jgi:hypothetical protein
MIKELLFNENKSSRKCFTPYERQFLIEKNPFCVFCNDSEIKNLVIDHIMPINIGGSNEFSNLTILCKKCNNKKWCYPINQFRIVTDSKKNKCEVDIKKKMYYLECLLSNKPINYLHTYESLSRKIEKLINYYYYLDKILYSIDNKKYKIF